MAKKTQAERLEAAKQKLALAEKRVKLIETAQAEEDLKAKNAFKYSLAGALLAEMKDNPESVGFMRMVIRRLAENGRLRGLDRRGFELMCPELLVDQDLADILS